VQHLEDVAESATAELDELPAADNVELFTDLRAWMAALVLLNDQGHLDNVTFGDDEDSQRLVRDAGRFHQGWQPGSPVRVPRRAPISHVPECSELATKGREQRPRRVRRSTGAKAHGPDEGRPRPRLTAALRKELRREISQAVAARVAATKSCENCYLDLPLTAFRTGRRTCTDCEIDARLARRARARATA
jgi:hypothetical protein